jgi:hypothetical protein
VKLCELNVFKMGSNSGRRLGVIYFRFTVFGNTYVLMAKSKQRKKNMFPFEYINIYT